MLGTGPWEIVEKRVPFGGRHHSQRPPGLQLP
jgi:hypothetical protein